MFLWVTFGNIMLGESSRHKRPETAWLHLYETSRRGKSTQTESRLVGGGAVTVGGCGVSFWGDKNVLE